MTPFSFEYFVDGALKRLFYTDGNGISLFQTRTDGTKINAPVEWAYDTVYNRVTTMTLGIVGQPDAEVPPMGIIRSFRIRFLPTMGPAS